jgi:exodeoxyribonuclease-5
MNYTPSQQQALDLFYQFLSDPTEPNFVLSGGSGKGKTFIAAKMLDLINDHDTFMRTINDTHSPYTVFVTATTNQAAERLSYSTHIPVTTIHSLLSLTVKDNYHTGKTELRQSNKAFSRIHNSVIFIDEASMINEELEGFIQSSIDMSTCKIVRIGDPDQILAVDSNEPTGLLVKTKYTASLVEYCRAASDNPITLLGEQFRQMIYTGKEPVIKPADTIVLLDGKQTKSVIDTLFHSVDQNFLDAKVITFTNKKCVEYGSYIRKKFYDTELFQPKEILVTNGPILAKDGQKVLFGNNNYVKVISCTESVDEIQGVQYPIYRVTLESLFNKDNSTATTYVFKYPEQLRNILGKLYRNREYSDYFNIKNRYADLRQTNSMTGHKAQGSTFKNVLIDMSDFRTCSDKTMFARMAYTVCTRPTDTLYIRGA